MEEVVAKRRNSAGAAYIFVILMGIAFIVAGIILGSEEKGALVIGLIIGVIMLAMGIYYTVMFFMIPSKVIVYKDGILYLPRKVTCKPEEIEKVFIKVYRNRRYGTVSKYGKMEITVGGKVYKYNDINNVKEAQDRLLELNRIAIAQLQAPVVEPQPVADPQPAVEAQPENDPFGEM